MSAYIEITIAAIATAPGRGGIGVVRVSGRDLKGWMLEMFGRALTPRHAHYLPFRAADGETLDEGIALTSTPPIPTPAKMWSNFRGMADRQC